MMFILRHLFFFGLQFALVCTAVVVGSIAYVLYGRGMSYAQTQAFHDDLLLFLRVGATIAAVFCLILFCYHMTRKALESRSDEQPSSSSDPSDDWRF